MGAELHHGNKYWGISATSKWSPAMGRSFTSLHPQRDTMSTRYTWHYSTRHCLFNFEVIIIGAESNW